MNTKVLMISSAYSLGILGFALSFFPNETAVYLNFQTSINLILVLQILGSLYLAFGVLNWMATNQLIGGIYGRPLVIGNLIHFGTSTIALLKVAFIVETGIILVLGMMLLYCFYALCFGYIFVTTPKRVL